MRSERSVQCTEAGIEDVGTNISGALFTKLFCMTIPTEICSG